MRALNEPSIYILIFYKKYYIIYIENKDKELINMIYRMRVHGQPTIFYEDEISVKADSPEEAAEMAKETYKEILDKRFGWADIDTINTDIIKEN